MHQPYAYARVAAIISCLLGGSAFAQETPDRPPGVAPATPQPMPAPREAGVPTEDQPAMGKQTEESKSEAHSWSAVRAAGISLSKLDRDQVMELQQALKEAGYYTAEVDGIIGARMKQALRRFYGDQAQLAAQGMISARGAWALGLDEADIERVRGQEPAEREKPPSAPQPPAPQPQQPPAPQPQQPPAPQSQQPAPQPQPPASQPQQPAPQPQPPAPQSQQPAPQPQQPAPQPQQPAQQPPK